MGNSRRHTRHSPNLRYRVRTTAARCTGWQAPSTASAVALTRDVLRRRSSLLEPGGSRGDGGGATLFVGGGRGDNVNVQLRWSIESQRSSRGGIDCSVRPKGVVTVTVELLGGQSAEVRNCGRRRERRSRNSHMPGLPQSVTCTAPIAQASRSELRDGLLGAGGHGLLAGDSGESRIAPSRALLS